MSIYATTLIALPASILKVAVVSQNIRESKDVTVALLVFINPVRLLERLSKPEIILDFSEPCILSRIQVTKFDFKYCAIVSSSGGKSPGGSEEQERGKSSVCDIGA